MPHATFHTVQSILLEHALKLLWPHDSMDAGKCLGPSKLLHLQDAQ